MKIKIYYVEVAPELESKEFDLASVIKSKGECIVGRSPECDLVLEGSDLSRQHGKFWIKDDYYYFADTGSSNGSLFNGELAERNQEYLLNLGDTIRIGDFVLKMEQEEEIAATVFKVIDPALFRSRQPQIVDASQPEPQISPVVPIIGLAGAAISMPIIVDRSTEDILDPVTANPPPSALVEDEWNEEDSSDDFHVDNKVPDAAIDAQSPSALIIEDEEDELSEVSETEEQSSELASQSAVEDEAEVVAPDAVIDAQSPSALIIEDEQDELSDISETEEQVFELASESVVEDEAEVVVPDSFIDAQSPSALIVEDEEDDDDELSEFIAQDEAKLVAPDAVIDLQSSSALIIEDEEDEDDEEIELSDVSETEEQSSELASESVVEDESEVAVPDSLIDAQSPSALIIEDEEDEDDEEIELSDLVIEDGAEVVGPDAVKNENQEDLDKEKNLQFEASSVPTDASVPAIVTGTSSTNNKKIGAELLSQKQIVLIAHDEKVADLTDLVNQHKDFLATCLTISWASIADSLRQETGMVISKELPIGVSGGFQTIAGLVNSGDVLAVIFLKDFFAQSQAGQANEEALLRLCNINEILLATNIATAESIIHYLQS